MNHIKRPLVEAIERFSEKNPVSFHVPGHKNGLLSNLPEDLRSALRYDYTELEGLDDLHAPTGIIQKAEQALSAFYESERSFFLVNGSTVGNLAMIYATCRAGDRLIVQRNAHKSIFNAIELVGAKPIYIAPQWDDHSKSVKDLNYEQIVEVLERHDDVKAVVLTYPTYYGFTSACFAEIIKLCHEHKIPVLVDEAHGAHFAAGAPFPTSALTLGADVVVHSAHKTLPAMTMGSYLHVRSTLVSHERIAHYLRILQSSSPSYLLLASLDDARAYIAQYNAQDKKEFMALRRSFIASLQSIEGITVVEADDPLKLLVRCNGYNGYTFQTALEKEHIYTELADPYQVLVILPLVKAQSTLQLQDVLVKIKRVVQQLTASGKQQQQTFKPIMYSNISHALYTAPELVACKKEWVTYEQAVGQIVVDAIIPYPPGIPLVLAGEKMTEEQLQLLLQLSLLGAKFQGAIQVEHQKIQVVKR